jgi:hypothetical protein
MPNKQKVRKTNRVNWIQQWRRKRKPPFEWEKKENGLGMDPTCQPEP